MSGERTAEKGENPRFLVTSLPAEGWEAAVLYEKTYCARGEMENRIKEQLSLFADRMSTESLRANQLRLYFSSLAYVLIHALRRLALAGTERARAQVPTIRWRLLKIAAEVRLSVRRLEGEFLPCVSLEKYFRYCLGRITLLRQRSATNPQPNFTTEKCFSSRHPPPDIPHKWSCVS